MLGWASWTPDKERYYGDKILDWVKKADGVIRIHFEDDPQASKHKLSLKTPRSQVQVLLGAL